MSVPSGLEALRAALCASVAALERRQANEIPEATLERLIELDWLEWRGGTLRLTTTGQNIHQRELALSRAGADRGLVKGRPNATSLRRP